MPVVVVAGDLLECTFKYSLTGVPNSGYINRIHFEVDEVTPGGGTSEPEAAKAISDKWATLVKKIMSSVARYDGVVVQKWEGGVRTAGSVSSQGAGVGIQGAPCLPAQNAFCISKRTEFAGRGFRGRMYVPGIESASQVNGTWTNDFLTGVDVSAFLFAMQEPYVCPLDAGNLTITMVVASSNGAGIPNIKARVTSGLANKVVRAQRRRQPDRGS